VPLKSAARRVAAWWPGADSELPVQVVHGDPAASNTLVDERTGEVTALLDFEIAGADFRVQDLVAGLLQSGALEGPRWQRRTAALVRGNFSARRLSHAEVRALPELLLCRSVGSVLWRAPVAPRTCSGG
jgi:homoserine kinase type II